MNQQTQKNLLDLVKRNYEEIAADFNLTRKKQLWPELIKLTKQIKAGSKVLDVGCGNGRLAGAFLDKDIKYLGVDNSEKLIEAASKNFSRDGRDKQFSNKIPSYIKALDDKQNTKYKFQVADILELDKLPEKDFAYVFCIAVLHHLPGADLRVKALKQMKNKISNNGKIIITVWNLWPQIKFRKLIFKYGLLKLIGKNKMDFGDILFDWKNNQDQPLSRRYYHAFTKNELKKLAVRAGLKIEKLYKNKYNYYIILTK